MTPINIDRGVTQAVDRLLKGNLEQTTKGIEKPPTMSPVPIPASLLPGSGQPPIMPGGTQPVGTMPPIPPSLLPRAKPRLTMGADTRTDEEVKLASEEAAKSWFTKWVERLRQVDEGTRKKMLDDVKKLPFGEELVKSGELLEKVSQVPGVEMIGLGGGMLGTIKKVAPKIAGKEAGIAAKEATEVLPSGVKVTTKLAEPPKPPVKPPTTIKPPVEPPPPGKTPFGKVTKPKETISGKALKVQEMLNDRTYGLRKMQTDIEAAGTKIKSGTVKDVKTALDINEGAANAGATRAILALDEVKRAARGVGADDINGIIWGNHSKEILAQKGGQRVMSAGFRTAKQIDDYINEIKTRIGDEAFSKATKGAEVIQRVYQAELKRMTGTRLSQETAEYLAKTYPWYNPLRYVDDAERLAAQGKSTKPFNVVSSGLKRLTEEGTTKLAERPLDVLTETLIKNEVWLAKNRTAESIITLGLEDKKLGLRIVKSTEDTSRLKTLSYFKDGVKQTYEVPEWMFREADTMEKILNDPMSSFIGALNGITRSAFTTYSPPFVVSNFLNDTLTAFVTSGLLPHESGLRLISSLRGLQKDKVLQSFRLSGGFQMKFYGGDVKFTDDIVKSGGTVIKSNRTLLKKAIDAVPNIGERGEQVIREAVFKKSLGKYLSAWKKMTAEEIAASPEGRKAAADAVNATINFGRGGYAIKAANRYIIFLNASMEGVKLPFRALKDSPAARFRLAGVMAGGVVNDAYNMTYPEYFDIPDEVRWGSVIVMLPSKEKDEFGNAVPNYLALVPRTREWGLFLGSKTYAMERLYKDVPIEFGRFIGSMAPQLSPVSSIPLPAVMEELTEQVANYDFYWSQPIVSEGMANLPVEEQTKPWVSRTIEEIANKLGSSPLRVQHVADGLFGGAGKVLTSVSDYILDMLAPQEVDPEIIELADELESITDKNKRLTFLKRLNASTKNKVTNYIEDRNRMGNIPVVEPIVRRVLPERAGQTERTAWDDFNKIVKESNEAFTRIEGIKRLGIRLGQIGDSIDNIGLTPAQRQEIQKVYNNKIIPAVVAMMNNTQFQAMGLLEQQQIASEFINSLKSSIRKAYLEYLKATGVIDIND